MANNVSFENVSDEIVKVLSAYTEELAEGIKQDARDVSKDLIKNLKRDSPKNTGEYAKGWRIKVEEDTRDRIQLRAYNAKKHWITHLLENGHVKRNGGRVPGIKHNQKNEHEAIEELESRVERRIQNGR